MEHLPRGEGVIDGEDKKAHGFPDKHFGKMLVTAAPLEDLPQVILQITFVLVPKGNEVGLL